MQALDALLNRVSVPRLLDPAPTAEQREVLFAAAMRAPDHGHLQPWRFLTVEGQAREQLGEILAQAALAQDAEAPQAVVDKARNGPLRAPLVVVVIAKLQEHVKYPKSEQLLAAGCAAHGILLAAYAQGIGAVWRTGELAYSPQVAQGLGLAEGEEVIAFLYLGTPQKEPRVAEKVDLAEFVSAWSGE
ncbi:MULTISPECIES: NAD(P)H nitroreductase [Pseudomonas]|jgi:nitroreductase|uniref:NAD(P)H nitroreductase n=1 Tax=Pseudomonas TaxID=286 RepID=UPI000481B5D7|nr:MULTISPECIES: NAD(P)H nitroreductase [Pseudomonas]PRA55752.1 NAD(P)H nitroreductase [Pseudomonas sp. MYb115]QXN51725.1 NAD(P)H nitroreductase [Pseudomonas fluorescens]WSO26050.1 NAD(P)H nitroreductase [Pseudomonas fluorescens]